MLRVLTKAGSLVGAPARCVGILVMFSSLALGQEAAPADEVAVGAAAEAAAGTEQVAAPPANQSFSGTVIVPGSELESMSGPLLRMVFSLLAVLAVLGVCAWLARRVRGSQLNGGLIQIVSGLSLGPKEKVVLLRVGDEEVLVGMSAAGMQPLHVLGQPTTPQRFSLNMGRASQGAAEPESHSAGHASGHKEQTA